MKRWHTDGSIPADTRYPAAVRALHRRGFHRLAFLLWRMWP